MPKLLNYEQLLHLDCSGNSDAQKACRFLLPMMDKGSLYFIDNLDVSLWALWIDDLILPIVVTNPQKKNSYVASPYDHYVRYAHDEVERFNNRGLRYVLHLLVGGFGQAFKALSIDSAVYVNNWLVSTNLHPKFSPEQIKSITNLLREEFPDKAIVFRSVNSFGDDGELKSCLHENGYLLVLSRQIYMQNPLQALSKKAFKIDLQLLKKSPYRILSHEMIHSHHEKRIVQLYNFLYTEKYSKSNPMFNERLVHLARKTHLLKIMALEKDGRIDGVIGFFIRDKLLTTPLFGYDTALPIETGLYRLLSLLITLEARKRGIRVHASAGAGHFKRLRGGEPDFEYSAVYTDHLSARQKVGWKLLHRIMTEIGRPLFLRMECQNSSKPL
jgi:hypothetical protein